MAKLIRSRRRSIEITVTEDASVVVRAPLRAPLQYIREIVEKKQRWITRKVLEARMRSAVPPRRFEDGEKFLFLGKCCELKLSGDVKGPALQDGCLYVPDGPMQETREALINWYKIAALQMFRQRCEFYSSLLGCSPRSVRISSAEKRWGSCGQGGRLNFCWRLIMAPLDIIDYIVVHEMAHIAHPGHSSRFWKTVAAIIPEYREKRNWLRENGHLLTL